MGFGVLRGRELATDRSALGLAIARSVTHDLIDGSFFSQSPTIPKNIYGVIVAYRFGETTIMCPLGKKSSVSA